MPPLTLVIGNKNYSSWSLRPWLVLRQAGIPFEEVRIPLWAAQIGRPAFSLVAFGQGAGAARWRHPGVGFAGDLRIPARAFSGHICGRTMRRRGRWPAR